MWLITHVKFYTSKLYSWLLSEIPDFFYQIDFFAD